jgi:hypothetical protein
VLRVPIPAAARLRGFGQQQQQQQQGAQERPAPLMLPGPAAFQALLHELGHALSYLCPALHLQQQQQQQQQQPGSQQHQLTLSQGQEQQGCDAWLFAADCAPGPWSRCLLASPPCGLDVRETSSHFMEHFARHPAAIVVGGGCGWLPGSPHVRTHPTSASAMALHMLISARATRA